MKTISTVETANGKLVYTLFSEPAEDSERYGITVLSRIFGDTETATVRDITADCGSAEKLMFLLADNTVLPSTLSEVVEEYVSAAAAV